MKSALYGEEQPTVNIIIFFVIKTQHEFFWFLHLYCSISMSHQNQLDWYPTGIQLLLISIQDTQASTDDRQYYAEHYTIHHVCHIQEISVE